MKFKYKRSITHGNTWQNTETGHRPACPNKTAANDIPKPHTPNTNNVKSRSTTKTTYVKNKA